MELEEELFAPDTWTAAMYREELAAPTPALPGGRVTSRQARRDPSGDGAVGYAGLIAYADEAHVPPSASTGARRARASGARLLDALLAEADRRSPRRCCWRCAPTTTPPSGSTARRGFTEIGRRRGYYQPSGADAVVMKREARAGAPPDRGRRA